MIGVALVLIAVAAGCFLWRLVTGPSLGDRVVALDGLLTVIVMAIGAYGALHRSTAYVASAVVVAFVAFVGSAIFARFIERRGL